MSENKEKGGVKVGWVFTVILELFVDAPSRIVEGMDFIYPERLSVKVVKPQRKPHHQAEKQEKYLSLLSGLTLVSGMRPIHDTPNVRSIPEGFCFRVGWLVIKDREASGRFRFRPTPCVGASFSWNIQVRTTPRS